MNYCFRRKFGNISVKNADTFWVGDAENVSAFFIEINRKYHAYNQKC